MSVKGLDRNRVMYFPRIANPPSSGVLVLMASLLIGPIFAADFRTFTSTDGKNLEARILTKSEESVTLVRKSDSREFTIPLARLIKEDQEYVKAWSKAAEGEPEKVGLPPLDWSQIEKRYYPRSLDELRQGFEEIKSTPQGSFSERDLESIVELNIFRFGSGVPLASLSKSHTSEAMEAAKACQEHGAISHDLGHFTADCSLGGLKGSRTSPEVTGFISDHGEKNRGHRGHRLEGLHYQMVKTGFGFDGEFMSHRVQDYSGRAPKEVYSYPGNGLYPLSRVVSSAWSLYLPETAPAATKLSVQVWKLPLRPAKRIGSGEEPEGEELKISWVSVERFAINFEPSTTPLNKEPGVYFVRIKGGGVREDYVVDLFDDTGWPCEYLGNYKEP